MILTAVTYGPKLWANFLRKLYCFQRVYFYILPAKRQCYTYIKCNSDICEISVTLTKGHNMLTAFNPRF